MANERVSDKLLAEYVVAYRKTPIGCFAAELIEQRAAARKADEVWGEVLGIIDGFRKAHVEHGSADSLSLVLRIRGRIEQRRRESEGGGKRVIVSGM
jgi:hypothetical protein